MANKGSEKRILWGGGSRSYEIDTIFDLLRSTVNIPSGFLIEVCEDNRSSVDHIRVIVRGPEDMVGVIKTTENEFREDPFVLAERIKTEMKLIVKDIKKKVAVKWMQGYGREVTPECLRNNIIYTDLYGGGEAGCGAGMNPMSEESQKAVIGPR